MKTVAYDKNGIYINGKKEKIVAGAIHYFRVMPEYWEDRLLKLKESGCNCVETYICWNLHEKKQGEFDFSGWLDFTKFLELSQKLGLYAIVRPGPYICSEWDLGGLPWWLLKYPNISLRCSDETYLSLCEPYLRKVCALMRPHLISNGGNIIFVQIENEYGSVGSDKKYLRWLKDLYIEEGIDCEFVTSDGASDTQLNAGTLPDVLATVNLGVEPERYLNVLKRIRPDQPLGIMEFWNGRCDTFGNDNPRRDVEEIKESLSVVLDKTEILSLYMFHGGTNFGFMNGGVKIGEDSYPYATTYDIDAPLDEYGRRTEKYYAEQELICKAFGKEIVNNAKDVIIKEYSDIKYMGECSLAESGLKLNSIESLNVKTMEQCDQGFGYIIYEMNTEVYEHGGYIILPEFRDIAHIYVDGKYQKTLTSCKEGEKIELNESGKHTVFVVIEALGRLCQSVKPKDFKGLLGDSLVARIEEPVWHPQQVYTNYKIYNLPVDELPQKYDGKAKVNEPAFYKYEFTAETKEDTVLHLKGFTRGVAFINGFNLGRHWAFPDIDNKLYIPAPLLKEGKNEIVIFDILHKDEEKEIILRENW